LVPWNRFLGSLKLKNSGSGSRSGALEAQNEAMKAEGPWTLTVTREGMETGESVAHAVDAGSHHFDEEPGRGCLVPSSD
jgi:hypothetical protein